MDNKPGPSNKVYKDDSNKDDSNYNGIRHNDVEGGDNVHVQDGLRYCDCYLC